MDGPHDCLPWLFWKWPYDFPIAVVTDCGGSGNVHKIHYDGFGIAKKID
jgi:hypothetical protein